MNKLPKLLLPLAGVLLATTTASAQKLRADPGYTQTNLVANKAEYNPQIIDERMRDAWGIALRPPGAGGHIWISNAGTGTSSEFIGDVPGNPLHQDGLKIVELEQPHWTDHGYAFVTGQAYNSASDLPGQPVEFPVAGPADNLKVAPPEAIPDGFSGSAKFIFVTEDGCINAWSANTAVAMKIAPLIIDYSKTAQWMPYRVNCVFTGAALTNNAADSDAYKKAGGNHLFVADIRNNAIQVFDNQWKDVTDAFHFQTPATVGGLHPFNIVDLGGHLFVAYGEFDPYSDEGQEQIAGAGFGHVVEYNEDGTLVKDFFAGHGVLNLPWGMAIAPAGFGQYANDLLVANFGDGTISAFNLETGDFVGYMRDAESKIISIDGIWGLAFGNGHSLGSADSLYFTAGPNNEQDGILGRLDSRHSREPRRTPDTASSTAAAQNPAAR
ncbi:MAG: TIGR03118 family protein [Chthoniobacter sp.]|uniref:TIGR03118 family protein n=1 Tax=Chthoniobacter sp. TaxID=2510640 RepID=UPI0032A66C12